MARESRIGLGFDVHAFCTAEAAEGRQLMLAGLAVEGRPLAGHSDADVVLHALCDAIYGALGLADVAQRSPVERPGLPPFPRRLPGSDGSPRSATAQRRYYPDRRAAQNLAHS